MKRVWSRYVLGLTAAAVVVAAVPSGLASASRSGVDRDAKPPTLNATMRGAESLMIGGGTGMAHAMSDGDISALLYAGAPEARGIAAVNAVPQDIGSWSAPFDPATPVVGVHAVMLYTGKVLMFGPVQHKAKPPAAGYYSTIAAVWDPVTRTSKRVDPPANVFCGGQVVMDDGKVLVAGGMIAETDSVVLNGIRAVVLFDPATETWSQLPDMARGRWYPTLVKTASGSVVIAGGTDETLKINPDIEEIGPDLTPRVRAASPRHSGFYPKMHLLPDGRVYFKPSNYAALLNVETWKFTTVTPTADRHANYPSTALLPLESQATSAEMIILGGRVGAVTTPALASVERIDFSDVPPKWERAAAMPYSRSNQNLVQLPDGTMLVVGGNQLGVNGGATKETLLFDPAANTWTAMASQQLRRAYHSTAVLLPDATVLSAGDNYSGGGLNKLEIFKPPYLFRGPRPMITSASTESVPGQNIYFEASLPITRAVLIAPAAVTHATDMHQRHIELDVVATATGFRAIAPKSGVAPPGPYMLFVLAADGTPSVARWINLAVAPSVSLASDSFTRTVSTGWGTSDSGTSWTATRPGNLTVNGTAGVIAQAQPSLTYEAVATGRNERDIEVSATIRSLETPVAGDQMVSVVLRRTASGAEYRARLRIRSGGAVGLSLTKVVGNAESLLQPEVTVSGLLASDSIRIVGRISGSGSTSMTARAFRLGVPDLGVAMASSVDSSSELQTSGTFGVATRLMPTATNSPASILVDDLFVVRV